MLSTDQGSDQAVPLADGIGADTPQITLAILGASGSQNPCILKINHHGVDGALVALRIHAHATDDLSAAHGTLLDQDAADHGAGDQVKAHRSGVVN